MSSVSPRGRAALGDVVRQRSEVVAIALLSGFLLLRLVLMVAIGFGNDEAYTVAVARTLHLSYFDHPPLHVWLTHIAATVFGESRWVRLPFVLLFTGTAWLVFLLTRRAHGPEAALWALLLFNITPFFTLSAGGWIVPDGPLLFCLLAAIFALVPTVLDAPQHRARPWRAWLAGGAFFGLAGLSKYNALPIALGLVAFVAVSPRRRAWLLHPAPYAGAALAGFIILPVVVWNARNGWVSFAFQTGRGLPTGLHPLGMGAMALGEMALLSPWIGIPLVLAAVRCLRFSSEADNRAFKDLLLWLALPSIVAFTLAPLWSARGLPHWPMPSWLFLYPLLGARLAAVRRHRALLRRWAIACVAGFALVVVIGLGAVHEGWISRILPSAARGHDPTLEALDWTALRTSPAFSDPSTSFTVAARWMDAGKIAVALGPTMPVYVCSDDPREFAFAPSMSRFLGRDAVIVIPAELLTTRLAVIRPYFAMLEPAVHLWLGREGLREVDLAVIRAHGLQSPFPVPVTQRATSGFRP